MKSYETIDGNDLVETAVKQLLNGQCKNFMVISNGHPTGSLSRDEIIEALSNNGNKATIDTVMNRDVLKCNIKEPIEIAYKKMLTSKNKLALVYDNEQFAGVLDLENILEFVMVKNAIGANK
jgi:predicted transcriptional regulator